VSQEEWRELSGSNFCERMRKKMLDKKDDDFAQRLTSPPHNHSTSDPEELAGYSAWMLLNWTVLQFSLVLFFLFPFFLVSFFNCLNPDNETGIPLGALLPAAMAQGAARHSRSEGVRPRGQGDTPLRAKYERQEQ
jgi:hypothetical protein